MWAAFLLSGTALNIFQPDRYVVRGGKVWSFLGSSAVHDAFDCSLTVASLLRRRANRWIRRYRRPRELAFSTSR